MMTLPAGRVTPIGARVFASQATAASGSPSAAAPAPDAMTSPFLEKTIPTSRGSKPSIGTTTLDNAIAPLLARSATVSASLIRQSTIRESTISSAATSPRVACSASAGVQSGPRRSRSSTTPISPSMRGAMNRPTGSSAPSR